MKKGRWGKLTAALLLMGTLGIGGTAAYFTSSDMKKNQLAVGHNTSTIIEDFPDPSPVPVPQDPEYKKTVCVANQTSAQDGFGVDCFVRVMLSFSNSDIGNAVTLLGMNTADWEHGRDGYYYYRKKLEEGQRTTPLMTGFRIDSKKVEDTWRTWLDSFSIHVYEESIEAEGFSDYRSAWAYFTGPIGT